MFKYSSTDCIILPIALLIIIAIAFLLKSLLKTPKKINVVFIVLSIVLLCLETSKQLFYIITNSYTYYQLPIHFCSIFIFIYPLSYFFGEKCSKIFKPMSFAFSALVVIMLYINPYSIIGNATSNIFGSFFKFHTFTHHHIIVLYFVLTLVLNNYSPRLIDCLYNIAGIIFYASFAIPCAYKFNANYVNILYSPISLLEDFRLTFGQVCYTILLFLLGIIAACSITIIYYFAKKIFNKKQMKKLES